MSVSRPAALSAKIAGFAAAVLIAVALPVLGTASAVADGGETPPPTTTLGHPWD
jgi:hypothetical protein